ncbi:hypothetical protein [Roseibium sp.]
MRHDPFLDRPEQDDNFHIVMFAIQAVGFMALGSVLTLTWMIFNS